MFCNEDHDEPSRKGRLSILAPIARLARRALKASVAAGFVVGTLAGCVSSHVLVGTPRPAISSEQVKIYLHPPATYEEIALLNSSSRVSWTLTAQQKTDKMIDRLKMEAAKLGANGILLQSTGDQRGGSVGVASSTASVSGNSANAIGVGSAIPLYQKTGTGIAIYVPPDPLATR